jgi:tRNA 2-selenouridine synthase
MTWRDINCEQLNRLREPLIVDVRSPCEHHAERIPGSVNVPLLSDAERAEVGTIYKQQGEVAARRHALLLISPKIPAIVDQVLTLRKPGQTIVVHCWRGGLRSEAVASFLSVVGIDCWRLTGGYKSWRQQVLADFSADRYQFVPVVLDGLTGAGKTDILKRLHEMRYSVLDLEALANHRGSVFGGMGLGRQPTQKNFDAALWQELRRFSKEPVFMEAESRKVGRLSLPDCIYNRIASGRKILVTAGLEARSRRIVEDYARFMGEELEHDTGSLLRPLKQRLGAKRIQEIEELARAGDVASAVKLLLTEYYDPLYQRQIQRNSPFELEVSGDDAMEAARTIARWAESLASSPALS